MPLKAKQAKDRARSSRAVRTDAIVARKSDSRKRRDGTRSSSKRARNGCNIAAPVTQATAVASIAPRHPRAPAIAGPRKPQISTPAGTAVCLIENTSGARRGGDTRPSNCELVGVETAAPPPPMTAEAPKPSNPPSAAAAMPPPSSTSAIWLMRSAP